MRRHFYFGAILAAGFVASAGAQEGSWGDGHAAIYNVPKGYSSSAEFNSIPSSAIGKRKKQRSPNATIYEADCLEIARQAGGGVGIQLDRGGARPNPMCAQTPQTPLEAIPTIGAGLSTDTAGVWNTNIVEDRTPRTGVAPDALNGGLNLE